MSDEYAGKQYEGSLVDGSIEDSSKRFETAHRPESGQEKERENWVEKMPRKKRSTSEGGSGTGSAFGNKQWQKHESKAQQDK